MLAELHSPIAVVATIRAMDTACSFTARDPTRPGLSQQYFPQLMHIILTDHNVPMQNLSDYRLSIFARLA